MLFDPEKYNRFRGSPNAWQPAVRAIDICRAHGLELITTSVLEQALSTILPASSLKKMGIISSVAEVSKLTWTQEALDWLIRIPEGFMREATREQIENLAHDSKADVVDLDQVEKGIVEGRKSVDFWETRKMVLTQRDSFPQMSILR